ncbi:MAG: hypothetical protein RRZ24_08035 [Clostridia bacterium]
MKLLCEKFGKIAMLRAAFFAGMSSVTLLFSGFLRGVVFYVVVGYVILCGVWSVTNYFLCEKGTKSPFRYGSLVTAAFMIAFSIISIIYGRYLVHIAPLYLGGLMLVNGLVYFVVAMCVKAGLQWLLTLLSILVLIGGSAIVIFTFGFEIVLTLAQVSSITLLLSCAYELVAYLIHQKSNHGHLERERIK